MKLALLLLLVVWMLSGKNSVLGRKTESGGDSMSSRWVSANCRGLWLVTCVDKGLLGSDEKGSALTPNRPPVRCMNGDKDDISPRIHDNEKTIDLSVTAHPVDALLSTLHCTLDLIFCDQVTWDGPVQFRRCFLLDAAQPCLQCQNTKMLLLNKKWSAGFCHPAYLNLSRVLFGRPVTVVFLLSLHELAEVFLKQEGGVELSDGDLILWGQSNHSLFRHIKTQESKMCPKVLLPSHLQWEEWPGPTISYWSVSKSS